MRSRRVKRSRSVRRRRSRTIRRRSKRVRTFRVAKGTDHVQVLANRQVRELPTAHNEMFDGKKTGHWAWWAWPCNRKGSSEKALTGSSTYVANQRDAERLVNLRGVNVWAPLLSTTAKALKKDGKGVIPKIDHSRIDQFCDEWEGYLANSEKVLGSLMVCSLVDFIGAWRSVQ